MIVNTAYPFMGKKGPAVNPNIWENGVVNYPYTGTGAAVFDPAANRFYIGPGNYVTFTLPLKNFSKITFNIVAGTGAIERMTVSVIKNGQVVAYTKYFPSADPKDIVYNIPVDYQENDTQIRINSNGRVYLLSGVMS